MDDLQEVVDKLIEIESKLDAIASALSDQFGGVDGLTFASQQTWNALIRIEQLVIKKEAHAGSIYMAVWLLVAVAVAHVIHHW